MGSEDIYWDDWKKTTTERCTCHRCSWDPSTNLELVALRQAWPNRSKEDREPDPVSYVHEGMVVQWKAPSVDEQVMYLIAKWIWDESVEEGE